MKKKAFLSNMGYFKPSPESPKIEFIETKLPTIMIKPEAYIKMVHLVDIAPDEVGWLGTVTEIGTDYLIDDVFLFEQQVSAATTEISEDGLAKFAEEMFKLPNGVDLMNKLKFWGHSHVNMGTFASGQDDTQMNLFKDSGHPYFIRGIFNKKGSITFTIYNYANRYIVRDPEWMLYYYHTDDIRETLKREYKEKVKEKTYDYGSKYYGSSVDDDKHGSSGNWNYNWRDRYDDDEYGVSGSWKRGQSSSKHVDKKSSKLLGTGDINDLLSDDDKDKTKTADEVTIEI